MAQANDLLNLTACELAGKIKSKELSAREAATIANARVEEIDGDVKAFLTTTPEVALDRADRIDERLKDGDDVKLHEGVPLVVKDVLSTKGTRTTCGSKMLENFTPVYDATSLKNFSRDLVMVGKANMDEFAMGSSTENSAYFPTRNPWDLERVPGGSSGGSAAAVAAGEGWWALGTDTGGSVRQPASFCGVVGLKPTYGRVSRYGLIAFASSLDQVGPITRDVRDSALLLQAIAGHDPLDSTSANAEVPDYLSGLEDGVSGLRVGVVTELMGAEGVESEVREVTEKTVRDLEASGASVGEVSLPHATYGLPAYYIIAPAELSSNLARFDGVRYGLRAEANGVHEMYRQTREAGFGDEAKRRIMLGTYALSSGYYDAYYAQAQKVRTRIVEDFRAAFADYDVLVTPTCPTPAFKLGDKVNDPLAMYANDICAVPASLAGIPAISIPAGLSGGMPVGVQLMANHFEEPTLLRAAYAAEQISDLRFTVRPEAAPGAAS